MAESVNSDNVVQHVKKLYGYMKTLSDNHNQLVEHIKDIHHNVRVLHQNVTDLRDTVTKAQPVKVDFRAKERQ